MGAQTDVTDPPFLLQGTHIIHELAACHRLKLVRFIDKMYHAEVHIIGLHPRKQILKGRLHQSQIPCPHILAVLPGGTDMPLDDPPVPSSLQCRPDIGTHIRLGHPAVQNIDPFFLAGINNFLYLLRIMPLQPFAAKSDLAHLKSCFS